MNNGQTRVLLVEDNPGDADLVRLRLLEGRSPVEVSCAERLADGLQYLSATPPSVVLLDLNLPDSQGANTFRRVLDRAPDVPVVILSGQEDEALAIKALHQGVQDYLVKGDITSRQLDRVVHYAIERQNLLRSLEMSRRQQLEFKNRFLSHVSHELRTPLTCIHQFVSILRDGLAGEITTDQRYHLDTILKSVNQLQAMIRDLLDASRAESRKLRVEPRCIVIKDLIQQATAMMQHAAKAKHISLECELDGQIPLVYADSDRVLQMLINLIDNAIKFTPPEGVVIVKATVPDADPNFVYLSVIDTGPGIAAEAKALIFDRLYQDANTIESSRGGLGLGLYITKELVELHGGRIWVTSELGHGSTFSLTLPLFSLAQLLFPVITGEGKLRDEVALVAVDLVPISYPPRSSWKNVRAQCEEILKRCIYMDRDLVIPMEGDGRLWDTLFIAASTDVHGAEIMLKRIRQQIESGSDLKSLGVLSTSVTPLAMPAEREAKSLEQLVQMVADDITERITEARRFKRVPSGKDPHETAIKTT